MISLRNCLPSLLSAGLLWLSFIPEWGWLLAHAALAPIWTAMARGRAGVFQVWLFGALFGAAYFFWLNVFSPLAPIVLTAVQSFWMTLALAPCLAAPVRTRPSLMFILISVFWIISEWLRGLGPYGYEWGNLGYTQYGCLRLAAYAGIGGVGLISAITLVSNGFLTLAFLGKNPRWLATAAVFWLALASASPYNRLSGDVSAADNYVILQTDVSPYAKSPDRDKILRDQLDAMAGTWSRGSADPVVLVLPETLFSRTITGLRGTLLEEPRFLLAPLLRFAPNRLMLVGAIEEDTAGFYNAAVLLDAEGRRLDSYRKRHLVPFGETMPGLEHWSWARRFGESLGTPFFSAGDTHAPLTIGAHRVGVLICFEGTFSRLTAESAAGADLLINLSNDAWSESAFGHEQHLRFLRFRAVETGLPVIRVGNTGPTALFAPNGVLITRIPHSHAGHVDLGRG
ncbi:apolipoprotein N-acyltransferase [bacterium]|nr:apolipoprotein N-acyltransferase [bacterium]